MKSEVFTLLIIILFAVSCIKEVDLSEMDNKDSLVVNSYMIADSTFRVYFNKTRKHSDTSLFFIDDADVKIVNDENILVEKLTNVGNGLYLSENSIVEQGETYHLEVDYNNLTLYAEDKIPIYTEMLELQYTGNYLYDDEGYKNNEIEISIEDDLNEENFYEIVPYIKNIDTSSIFHNPYHNNEGGFEPFYLESIDPVFINEDYQNNGVYSAKIFSDKDFSGSVQKIKFYYTYIYLYNDDVLTPDHVLKIELRTVSKNYYLYKKYLMKHLDNQSSDFWYGIVNPINLYSNVTNGIGIFAGYSCDTDSLIFNGN